MVHIVGRRIPHRLPGQADTALDINIAGDFNVPSSSRPQLPSSTAANPSPKLEEIDTGSTRQESTSPNGDQNPKKDYSHLRQTASSLVDIVLDSVKNLGSNLPSIGAIDVVKSIKERLSVREFKFRPQVGHLP